jgi:transposase-like protein
MNQLNNYFLWGKYDLVIDKGQEYIQIPEAKDKEEIIEKRNQPYLCNICNTTVTLKNKSRHEKTQKHLNNIK